MIVMAPLVDILKALPLGYQDEICSEYAKLTVEHKHDCLELCFVQSLVKGGGSRAMQELTDAADQLHLRIQLYVHPIRSYARNVGLLPLNKKQLRAWYERHGFAGTTDLMEREPKCQ